MMSSPGIRGGMPVPGGAGLRHDGRSSSGAGSIADTPPVCDDPGGAGGGAGRAACGVRARAPGTASGASSGITVTSNSGASRISAVARAALGPLVALAVLGTGMPGRAAAAGQVAAYYDGGMPAADIPSRMLNDIIYAF